ncbi:MAG: DUF4832 domain-containing protein [Bacteroidales bacterium]|nr:DUF4832 domain-containing protein [Bacteroidales bacterium]
MRALKCLAGLALLCAISCNREEKPWVPENLEDYPVKELHSQITHVQPMTGIVLWEDTHSTKSWLTLEFAYMLYSDVCKEKDVYDWSPVEELLESIASRGHQAVIRFRYTYVGKSCAVPDYIKAWPGYKETKGKSEGRTTYFPDWRCEELQRFHMEFHRRFAEKYDSDPRLAFLETGFGLWAEYHIYDGPFVLGQTFPSKAFQAEFLSAMDGWFVHTPWMISIDAADDTYSPFESTPKLLKLNFGNFDDSFMCEDHDGYNFESWEFFGKDRYKKAPLGGEFSYYSDYDQKHCLDKKGMYGRKFEDEAAKFHMTFIIGADQPSYQGDSRLKEASMSMGYRFKVEDFRVVDGEALLLVRNTGVAPIYRDAFMAVAGVRSSFNLRTLMPGTSRWMSVSAPSIGPENCAVAVECDHLVPGQKGIEFEAGINNTKEDI